MKEMSIYLFVVVIHVPLRPLALSTIWTLPPVFSPADVFPMSFDYYNGKRFTNWWFWYQNCTMPRSAVVFRGKNAKSLDWPMPLEQVAGHFRKIVFFSSFYAIAACATWRMCSGASHWSCGPVFSLFWSKILPATWTSSQFIYKIVEATPWGRFSLTLSEVDLLDCL